MQVSTTMETVAQAADETGQSASRVLRAADELAQGAATLSSGVDEFLGTLVAA
jgi:methyl-accepting chemotaxis protein